MEDLKAFYKGQASQYLLRYLSIIVSTLYFIDWKYRLSDLPSLYNKSIEESRIQFKDGILSQIKVIARFPVTLMGPEFHTRIPVSFP